MSIQVNIMSYKYGHIASHAIESVLAQTKKADKIVLIDDGVGDCRHIRALYPMINFVERGENLGIVRNFNQALEDTECDKVLFLGADNWLRPDALERLSTVEADIVSYDIAITGTDAQRFGGQRTHIIENGYYLWRFQNGDITKGNFIHGSSLYDTKIALEVGGYNKSGSPIASEEDWVLWQRMIKWGATHKHVTEAMLYYRRHEHNFQKY